MPDLKHFFFAELCVKEWLESFCRINDISEKAIVRNQLLEELDRMTPDQIQELMNKSLFTLLSSEE